jgi:hypothetical protein
MDSHNFIEENVFPVPKKYQSVAWIVFGIVFVAGFIAVAHWDYERITSDYQTFSSQ